MESNIGSLICEDGQWTTTSPQDIANILQTQYIKAWSTSLPNRNKAQEGPDQETTTILADIQIKIEDTEVNEIKTSVSPRLDGTGTNIIKNADSISTPLQVLWGKSLDTGEIQEIFKLANTKPVFKGGSKR